MSLNIDQAIRTVMQQDASLVEILHGPAVEVVSSLLRSMLVSAKGNVLVAADYSSIEARVLAWLAGEKSLLTSFSNGYDVYRLMASTIYQVEVESVCNGRSEKWRSWVTQLVRAFPRTVHPGRNLY